MCYTTEVISALGLYATQLMTDVAFKTMEQHSQILASEVVIYFPKTQVATKKQREKAKKAPIETKERPGHESALNNANDRRYDESYLVCL